MHITKIELENIKSHADATFEFSRGTTAITGENGAGKTTLIEAIAWTLFDLLDYKKDDFARRGTKKGIARVTFESSLDEREYTVYRDTGTGYYVYDPRLQMRIADKREEVTRFLWQHLGVEPGTDLESLFKQAIGVPQGTFTAIFLATAAERKKTFDALLKVEEYRRGADELLKTSRYIERQIGAVNVSIARAEGELARYELVEEENKRIAEDAAKLGGEIEAVEKETREKQAAVTQFDEKEKKITDLRAAFEKLQSEKAKGEIIRVQKENELDQTRDAASKIEKVKADAVKHTEVIGRIKELEREREAREKYRLELAKIESAITAVKTDQNRFQDDLAAIRKAHKTIESLKTLVAEQEVLEKSVDELRNRVADLRAKRDSAKNLDGQIERLRVSYKTNHDQLVAAEAKAKETKGLDAFQKRENEIVKELAKLNASLERDEKFQSEVRNGLCPILSEKCLNVKEGQTLEGFLTSQFEDFRAQITVLEGEHAKVGLALRTSREAEKFLAQLPTLKAREAEISEEGHRLKNERKTLEKGVEDLTAAESEYSSVEAKLKALDDPRAKVKILENEIRRESEIQRSVTVSEKNFERLESDRKINVEQLEAYKDLDAHWADALTVRDNTAGAYRTFLANEAAAKLVSEREAAFEAAKTKLAKVEENLAAADRELDFAGKDYDREAHLSEKVVLLELQKRQAGIRAMFDSAKKREAELSVELTRLGEISKSMQGEFREKERHEKVAEVTDFIRTTLKEAAPLVARNYVFHVSLEANQMFREITGNAEQTLKWVEDYGIMLEESGYDLPFISLSGGEQMAAALSVRLALLKQLSDIRIAFFDEPTTNMDAERRENLAMQISQITNFDQLFVISHDDAFEGYMDHEIQIGD